MSMTGIRPGWQRRGGFAVREVWAVVKPDGDVLAEGGFKTEADAWAIALGWPSPEEVEHRKREGYFAVKATVTYRLED